MSTNTKKKHGTGAAVVLIVLCLLALGTLGYIIWRQFNPVVPETAAGYVAAAGTTAPVYDENGTQLGSLVRGAEVQYVAEDAEDGADRIRVVNGEGYAYLDVANLTADYSSAVLTETALGLLKDQFPPESYTRIYPVVRDVSGGINIIPDEAVLETYVRAADQASLMEAAGRFYLKQGCFSMVEIDREHIYNPAHALLRYYNV